MRKLKKWAALGMAGILAAGCLAGCGDKKRKHPVRAQHRRRQQIKVRQSH